MKFKLKFLRPLAGVALIGLSVLGLVWWETGGREAFTMESVLIAKEEIKPGQVVNSRCFTEVKNISETTVEDAILPQNVGSIKGHIAKQYIPKGAQVTQTMFVKKSRVLGENQSVFPLKEQWIDARSSSLRKGDTINIYDSGGQLFFGTFQIAYVKDTNEQEVVGTEANISEELLQRDFSSAVISHVEILASLEDYNKIWEMTEQQGTKLLLIQKGEKEIE